VRQIELDAGHLSAPLDAALGRTQQFARASKT
jgi:hypothetical protein